MELLVALYVHSNNPEDTQDQDIGMNIGVFPACPAQRAHQGTKACQKQERCLDVHWQQHSDTCSSRPGTETFLRLSHSTRELWVGVKQLENHKPTTGWLSEMTGGFCFEPVCEECRYLDAAVSFTKIMAGAFWRLCPFGCKVTVTLPVKYRRSKWLIMRWQSPRPATAFVISMQI